MYVIVMQNPQPLLIPRAGMWKAMADLGHTSNIDMTKSQRDK
jgi:hypothetical protein